MPSIEDLKNIPVTGANIELNASTPAEDEPVNTVQRANTQNVRINIGGANNTGAPVRRPKTIIGQQKMPEVEEQHTERQELDLNTLPLSATDQAYNDNTKESPMEDIVSDIDSYLDEKEDEIREAYQEVAQNIAEKEAEEELDNGVSEEEDDIDSILNDDEDELEEDKPKTTRSVITDDDSLDALLKEDEDDMDDISVSKNVISTSTDDTSFDDEDDEVNDDSEKELSEEASSNDREEYLKKLKELATEKLKPAAKQLNLTSFSIVRKPTTNLNFLKQNTVGVAKWVLPNQESIVFMREYLGIELEELRRFSEDSTSPTSLTKKFRSIYDHIESPKPATFEAWLKSTPYSDIDHYFFGIFIASYQGTNYIPYDCKNKECNATFLTDDVKIMDMVKFKDEEGKAKFRKIYQSEEVSSTKEGIYISEVVQISDRIAIAFKEPTIYNVIENNSLDADFRRKYSNIINYVPYIDTIYIIDTESAQLIPVGYKIYDNNATKTFKSKIQKYSAVFKSLSNDEFTLIQSYVSSVIGRETFMSYQYPEVECPECHNTIPATDTDAESAVFTRYQLGALVNTTLS